jgi:DNA-directed RNA polymerase specialized sigma subunit
MERRMKPRIAERNAEIVRLRLQERLTLADIGKRYGLTKQRIAQIVALPPKN